MAELQLAQTSDLPAAEFDGGTPQEMAARLEDMKTKLNLVQQFFKEVMVPGQDYGVIPGTDKPILLKPGAEKLNELYGYAPAVKSVEEITDKETGFYRARVTVALIHRRTGTFVAEGVGEANTSEGRYRYRWLSENKLPAGIDKSSLHAEEREGRYGRYKTYRLENEDPWTLWNTVLKMAKKRALIDATLSATRSSGLFTQDVEDLKEWVSSADSSPGQQNSRVPRPASEKQLGLIKGKIDKAGFEHKNQHTIKLVLKQAGIPKEALAELTVKEASELIDKLDIILAQMKEEKEQAEMQFEDEIPF